jgi:hypothetical protein
MTQTSLTIYIVAALIALLVSVPGVLTQLWIYRREKERHRASPLFSAWSELQTELVKTLHHPHPDRTMLTGMLRKIADDNTQSDSERLRAQFLLLAMHHLAGPIRS